MQWYYIDEEFDFDPIIDFNEYGNPWTNYEDLTGTFGRDNIRTLHTQLRNVLLF